MKKNEVKYSEKLYIYTGIVDRGYLVILFLISEVIYYYIQGRNKNDRIRWFGKKRSKVFEKIKVVGLIFTMHVNLVYASKIPSSSREWRINVSFCRVSKREEGGQGPNLWNLLWSIFAQHFKVRCIRRRGMFTDLHPAPAQSRPAFAFRHAPIQSLSRINWPTSTPATRYSLSLSLSLSLSSNSPISLAREKNRNYFQSRVTLNEIELKLTSIIYPSKRTITNVIWIFKLSPFYV